MLRQSGVHLARYALLVLHIGVTDLPGRVHGKLVYLLQWLRQKIIRLSVPFVFIRD